MVDIAVVLPTFNRGESLKTTLDSFSHLTLPPDLLWELIIVDNNSTTTLLMSSGTSRALRLSECVISSSVDKADPPL